MDKKIKIKVYSDKRNTSSVTTILKQLSISGTAIVCQTPRYLEIEENDIIILFLSSNNSNLVKNCLDLIKTSKNKFIVIIRNNSALLVSTLVKLGLTNIFIFPDEISEFISYLNEIITGNFYLTAPENNDESELYDFNSLIGKSDEFSSVIEIARKVSGNSNVSVLLLGETGTGKGLLAKAIHKNSNASDAPFVEIVCSAIPDSLLESELFGYEKGAFTNALNRKQGLFEIAENGTLFLDEIGDLSFNLQVKLLRVIEKKTIRRLGSVEDIPVKTRIISATNRDLDEMVRNDLFRKDLYHRLNVISIKLPPLRERGNDIILLAEKFIEDYNRQYNKSVNAFEDGLIKFLLSYSWPGNVRELKNALERAVLLSDDNLLRLKDFSGLLKNLPLNILEKEEHLSFHPYILRLNLNYENTSLLKLSKIYAREVLRKMSGNKSKSAKILGISRPKLDKLLH